MYNVSYGVKHYSTLGKRGVVMADYVKMYKVLFRAITKAIEDLQAAQIEAEEIYISAEDTPIVIKLPDASCENEDDNHQQ